MARDTGPEAGRAGRVSHSRVKPVAHQHHVSTKRAAENPRLKIASLKGCTVAPITFKQAEAIILAYEWLGSMSGSTIASYGLFSPDGELLGVECFGNPYSWRPTITGATETTLSRGACVHFAPDFAASYLIKHACAQAHRDYGWEVFTAYADPDAGEVGKVYQYAKWFYLGQGTCGKPRTEWLRPGREGWISSRQLAKHGYVGVGASVRARADGWISRQRVAKHKYVHLVADEPRLSELRAIIEPLSQPYPYRTTVTKIGRGRPRRHASNADRQRAYRRRMRAA